MKLGIIKVLVSLGLLSLTVSPALAQPFGPPNATGTANREVATNTGKLRSCQARETAIKTRIAHLISLANNMLSTFNLIEQRVEAYYNTKVVPSGTTVKNYNTLASNIQSARETVTTALNKAQTDVNGFSCTNANPKGNIAQFRADMQAVKTALKNYRTSIKNLIVAVRGVVKASPSPTPTATP